MLFFGSLSNLDDLFQSLLIEMLGLLQALDGVVVQVKIELCGLPSISVFPQAG